MMKSISVLLIPSVFACGMLTNQVAKPSEPLAVRDSAGRVRLTAVEGENGAFGLMLLGTRGEKRCEMSIDENGVAFVAACDRSGGTSAALSVKSSGDCRLVLDQETGVDCRIMGFGKTGDMSLGFVTGEDSHLAGFDCRATGEAQVYVKSAGRKEEEGQISRSASLHAGDGKLALILGNENHNFSLVEAAEDGAEVSMNGDGKTSFKIVREAREAGAGILMTLHGKEGRPRVACQVREGAGSGIAVLRKDGKPGVKLGLKSNDDVSMELVNPNGEVLLRIPEEK